MACDSPAHTLCVHFNVEAVLVYIAIRLVGDGSVRKIYLFLGLENTKKNDPKSIATLSISGRLILRDAIMFAKSY